MRKHRRRDDCGDVECEAFVESLWFGVLRLLVSSCEHRLWSHVPLTLSAPCYLQFWRAITNFTLEWKQTHIHGIGHKVKVASLQTKGLCCIICKISRSCLPEHVALFVRFLPLWFVCIKQVVVNSSMVIVNQRACYHVPYICILSWDETRSGFLTA